MNKYSLEYYVKGREDGSYHILYCLLEDRNNDNIPYSEKVISALDYHEHASRIYQPEYVSDIPDYMGNHVQVLTKVPFKEFKENNTELILMELINSKYFTP